MNDFQIGMLLEAIDAKNIEKIKLLTKDIKESNKNLDIVFEIYNNRLLTFERLKFIIKNCFSFLKISTTLIKKLLEDDNIELLDIIFNTFKFFDKESILKLLLLYENKIALSTNV